MEPMFGWTPDPAESARIVATLERPTFDQAAPHLVGTGEGKDVFLWEAEQKVLGRLLGSWNQGSIGSCVSHGWGRTAQDLMLIQIAMGAAEEWPGAEVCREAIYGGSRYEVGGQHNSYSDGSVGAWAAKWVNQWGILLYMAYAGFDLTNGYDVTRCKTWGAKGVPDTLEPIAKQHPVQDVTLVTTPEQARDLLANLYPVGICGSTSRNMKRSAGGWCPKTGNNWPHCEELRGVCVVKGGSGYAGGDGAFPFAGDKPGFVEQNSWGDYLGSDNNQVQLASGRTIELPAGCYLSAFEDRVADLRQQDTFAAAHGKFWKAQTIPWSFQ